MKIKFIQYYYSKDKDYLKHCEHINRDYCSKYGIDYYCEKDEQLIRSMGDGRNLSWVKIPLLLTHMHDCDYIIYADADAFVMNHDLDVRDIISACEYKFFICGEDFGPDKINGGVLIFRNTVWSKDFLERVWRAGAEVSRGRYMNDIWLEQTILSAFMIICKEDRQHTFIWKHDVPNAINALHMDKGGFIYHDISKSRISEFYKLKYEPQSVDILTRMNLITATDRQVTHRYFDFYAQEAKKCNEFYILDVGGDNGATFPTFVKHMPNVRYVNISTSQYETSERMELVKVEQINEQTLTKYTSHWFESPTPEFDMIIADNKHTCQDRDTIFWTLFPLLKSGGVFVIEDLQTDLEITNPEKNAQYGWGDPTKRSMTDNIRNFKETKSFKSDYIANALDLGPCISNTDIYMTSSGSTLGLIYKQ